MNIALFVPGGVDQSGCERVIPALLAFIERLALRHQVWVIALNQYADYRRYLLLGAEVINLGHYPAMPSPLAARFFKVCSLLKDEGLSWDILHAFWVGPCSNLALVLGHWLKRPVVVSLGGGEPVWLADIAYGGLGGWRGRWCLHFALKHADIMTVGSEYLKRCVKSPTAKLYCLPLGVDACYWQSGPTKTPPWRLLHVASINQVKDPDTLLAALQRLVQQGENMVLDWIGEDTLGGVVERKAKQLNLCKIIQFHGFIENLSLLAFYQQAHVLVQSSRHEGQGVAVCEAAAAGVPTVGTAVGLVAELAPKAALATPVRDPVALADGISRVLHNDVLRERLGCAAQQWARQYDADWSAAQFMMFYVRLHQRLIA